MTMKKTFPPPEQALELDDEELGVFILRFLAEVGESDDNVLNLNNFLLRLKDYTPDFKPEINEAFTEAWMWLEREGFLAPHRGKREWQYITKRGRGLLRNDNLDSYRKGNLLRAMNLDPTLTRKVKPTYLRGDYDTAVFQAFKEVEVRVRNASNLGNDKIGVSLMRSAFDARDGPLTDKEMETGEREALAHLFAGAIGSIKNPSSHRHTDLDDPQEAAEAILLANYLLRVVGRSVAQKRDTTGES